MALASCGLIAGVHLDGWAHSHGKVDQSFFTPWHAVLYTSFFVLAAVIVGALALNRLRSTSWLQATPRGYELAPLGVAIFALGGVGDMIWHVLFGIEVGVEALVSPSHLLLAVGASLMITAPLRRAWQNADLAPRTFVDLVPALLSVMCLLTVLSFFTEFANATINARLVSRTLQGSGDVLVFRTQSVAMAGFVIQTALVMGIILLLLRRWMLPFGSVTLILTLTIAFSSVLTDQYRLIPAAAVAGLLADVLIRLLRPSTHRPLALRSFAFALPLIFYGLHYLTIALTSGIAWSVHLWTGTIVVAGLTSLLLSYLLVPPAVPAEAHSARP
jgi:hypothetical protein